jgi:hypothetical protein
MAKSCRDRGRRRAERHERPAGDAARVCKGRTQELRCTRMTLAICPSDASGMNHGPAEAVGVVALAHRKTQIQERSREVNRLHKGSSLELVVTAVRW